MSLAISEVFHSIQGESTRAGLPCVFVRLTGCNLRCVWCDTAYAFEGGVRREVEDLVSEVRSYGCPLVEVTGGEPLLQAETPVLVRRLLDEGLAVMVETGGSLDISAIDPRAVRVVDIKCPGSGESHRNRWENLALLTPRDEVKFVVMDRADYKWARGVVLERGLAGRCEVLFAPVWGRLDPAAFAAWILEDRLPVRLQIQVHKVIWGEARGR